MRIRTMPAGGVALVAIACLGATPFVASARQGNEVLGRWRGTSTCVKAEWNSSCNDETVVYFFERTTGAAAPVTLHAFKYVGRSLESMGDIGVRYDAATQSWVAPFSNARVRIQWS